MAASIMEYVYDRIENGMIQSCPSYGGGRKSTFSSKAMLCSAYLPPQKICKVGGKHQVEGGALGFSAASPRS
jgi:hypothetical protein